MSDSKNYKDWLKYAGEDLLLAEHELKLPDDEIIVRGIIFNSQQASEKCLKAFLYYKNIESGKIHDLEKLQDKCPVTDSEIKNYDFKNLNELSIDIKYPGDMVIQSVDEAKEYFGIAKRFKELVENKIEMDINKRSEMRKAPDRGIGM